MCATIFIYSFYKIHNKYHILLYIIHFDALYDHYKLRGEMSTINNYFLDFFLICFLDLSVFFECVYNLSQGYIIKLQ